MLKRILRSFFLLLFSTSLLAQNQPKRFEVEFPQMGTVFRVIFYANDTLQAQQVSEEVKQLVDSLNYILSDYLLESEVNQLCKTAGTNKFVRVSLVLGEILEESKKISKETKGAFDCTISPLVRLWRTARKTKELPSNQVLKEAKKKVGYRKIKIQYANNNHPKVKLKKRGMQLDFGGIAKGYAGDQILRLLQDKFGVHSVLVDAGGDIVLGDAPPDREGWVVEVQKRKEEYQYKILSNCAIATSGDRYQFVKINGIRYSHIVDPKTGLGLKNQSNVTVIAPNGTVADSFASALSILGEKRGKRILKEQKNVQAIFQD